MRGASRRAGRALGAAAALFLGVLALPCFTAAVTAAPGQAPDALSIGRDFHVGHRGWNGLSDFASLARDAGCPVEVRRPLDWSALDGQDVLVFLHPEDPIDEQNLISFLSVGGRAVIADDFGGTERALARLGITRRSPPMPPATQYYREGLDLPVADSLRYTPLGRATPKLVANHSAYLTSGLSPTFSFAPGASLVIEGKVQQGRFVALADPSVLINNMLQIGGNRDFALALIRDLCRPQRDRLILVYGAFTQRGAPPAILPGAPSGDILADVADRWNRSFNGANLHIQETLRRKGALGSLDAVALVGILFSIATMLLLLRYLPMPAAPQSAAFAQPPRPPETGLFASIQRYAGGAGQAVSWGYVYPATLVREEVLARLAPHLTAAASEANVTELRDLSDTAVERALRTAAGPQAARIAAALWREFARLDRSQGREPPPEAPATTGTAPRRRVTLGTHTRVSERTLRRWYEQALALFAELDKKAG